MVSACGDDDSSSSSSGQSVSQGAAAPGGIPEVTANARDLEKEPMIAAGGSNPPTELKTADLVTGEGQTAVASNTVNVRYTGVLYSDGTKFDASWNSGNAPVEFPLSGVVPGFAQGIVGMKIGGRREIVIPPALGYGDQTSGPIPGGSTLVFVVDLVSVS